MVMSAVGYRQGLGGELDVQKSFEHAWMDR
jgi:hypothetical protein